MRFGGQFTYIQRLNVAYGAYEQAVEEIGANLQDGMNNLVNSAGNPGGNSPLVAFDARVDPGVLPCHTDIFGNLIGNSCLRGNATLESGEHCA